MNGRYYFASDFHLGIPDRLTSLGREKKLVAWLDLVRKDAKVIYLMGDLFDFWFEYRTVIPRGYARLLGKLSEITDSGIEVHLFRGNHDMWAFGYLQEELGIIMHRESEIVNLGGKVFYLAHGDGLGPGDHGYKFIKRVFACRFNQWLFRWLHPDLGIPLALFWSRKSRVANEVKEAREEERNLKLIRERLLVNSGEVLKQYPDVEYLVYGHYHMPAIMPVGEKAQQIVLGDWLTHFSYGVFDGEDFQLKSL